MPLFVLLALFLVLDMLHAASPTTYTSLGGCYINGPFFLPGADINRGENTVIVTGVKWHSVVMTKTFCNGTTSTASRYHLRQFHDIFRKHLGRKRSWHHNYCIAIIDICSLRERERRHDLQLWQMGLYFFMLFALCFLLWMFFYHNDISAHYQLLNCAACRVKMVWMVYQTHL